MIYDVYLTRVTASLAFFYTATRFDDIQNSEFLQYAHIINSSSQRKRVIEKAKFLLFSFFRKKDIHITYNKYYNINCRHYTFFFVIVSRSKLKQH